MLLEIALAIITINSTIFLIKKIYEYITKPENYCMVCFTKCEDILECGHYTHDKCLIEWGKLECPLCEKKL